MLKRLLNNAELERLSKEEKIKYFSDLKKYCLDIKNENKKKYVNNIINKITPYVRDYDFKIIGTENIPSDGKALFVVNHSNAHDFFTMQEAFNTIGIDKTFLASNEDLNSVILSIFESCGGVLFDRKDKSSATKAFFNFTSNIANGMPGVIYAESTWNLHPFKPMHLIKTGAANIAAITNVPIIPTIYEYVETPNCCTKESKIYSECIVKFGKPIYISRLENMIEQTDKIQFALEKSRLDLWDELKIMKKSIADIDQEVYLNHTYLKKFGGAGEYDSKREMQYLLIKDKLSSENEYHIDENGNFVAGILSKEEGKKYVKSR